jgi:uncharacterized SAM-binding protein YcdF (DUF218 family)
MNQLLTFIFSPDSVPVVFLAGALLAAWRPQSTTVRRIVLITATLYATASIYVVPAAAVRVWTREYRPLVVSDVGARPVAVVVLSATEEQIVGWSDRVPLMTPVGSERVVEAARVFKLLSPDWLVSSGGPPPERGAPPSSTVMRDALVRLGVPESRILLESSSGSTREQAMLVGPILRSHGVREIVLVTSDVHMPRALGAFRAAGLQAVPAIAPDPTWSKGWRYRWRPTARGLGFSGALAHELIGVPYYWARGWWHR